MSKKIIIAKIGKPYQLKGWTFIWHYTSEEKGILNYNSWYIDYKKGYKELKVKQYKINKHRKGAKVLALFRDFETIELVKTLTNKEIFIFEDSLPSLSSNEFYIHEIEGFLIKNYQNILIGKNDYYFNANGLDNIKIIPCNQSFDQKSRILPLDKKVADYYIDKVAKILYIDWDESLL